MWSRPGSRPHSIKKTRPRGGRFLGAGPESRGSRSWPWPGGGGGAGRRGPPAGAARRAASKSRCRLRPPAHRAGPRPAPRKRHHAGRARVRGQHRGQVRRLGIGHGQKPALGRRVAQEVLHQGRGRAAGPEQQQAGRGSADLPAGAWCLDGWFMRAAWFSKAELANLGTKQPASIFAAPFPYPPAWPLPFLPATRRQLSLAYHEFAGPAQLSADERRTWEAARAATELCLRAVLALSRRGRPAAGRWQPIFQGTNQENAAYPSGLCAERTALVWAGWQPPYPPAYRGHGGGGPAGRRRVWPGAALRGLPPGDAGI